MLTQYYSCALLCRLDKQTMGPIPTVAWEAQGLAFNGKLYYFGMQLSHVEFVGRSTCADGKHITVD